MASTGYIKNGKYIKVQKVPLGKIVAPQQSTFKQSDHTRQRFDHSAEILQPYDHQGKPNKSFIEADPDAAEQYGFLPKSGPASEHAPPAGGSVAWGQVKP